MTPTERARALLLQLLDFCEEFDGCQFGDACNCRRDIAAAANHIRRAENDAYERVASWLDKTRYSSALAKDVRAMKHEVK